METTEKKKRLLSLDVLRGITVAGMILVNNAGGPLTYEPLHHVKWNGMSPCDLVFPFFLFIMGISTYISISKFQFQPSAVVLRKIVKRTILILCIGWAIHWFECVCKGDFLPFDHLRLTGVLPRIAICYGIVSLLVLYMNHKYLKYVIACLLVGYALLLCLGNGYIPDDANWLVMADRHLLGVEHLYRKSPVDPEGIVSTLSALAHTLIGFCCGKLLLQDAPLEKKILDLFIAGFLLMAVGGLLTFAFPLNKRIWSPTFVLVTCGLAAMLQATLVYFIDMKGKKGWCKFFEVFGVNPLFLYVFSEVASVVISVTKCKPVVYEAILLCVVDPYVASLVYALAFVGVMGALGYVLYRKRIFIKL